jgi:hypothetical protein
MSQFTPPLNPLATLFHGTVTIEPGCDAGSNPVDGGLYGFGDMFVSRQVQIGYNSSLPTLNPSTGSLVVHGGIGVLENANVALSLNVLGTNGNATNLRETHIDTTWGGVTVTGGNEFLVSIGQGITFVTTNNSFRISSANYIISESYKNTNDAIQFTNTNIDGGMRLLTGQNSGYQLTTGQGGFVTTTCSGNIILTANNGNGGFTVNASQSNQNLTLDLTGNTDSGILIQSAGKNTTLDAIAIKTVNSGGNIVISNSGGTSNANIQLLAGTSGIIGITNTGGPIQFTARDASSFFVVKSATNSKDLRVAVDGITDSSLILESEGVNNVDAITLRNTNTLGSMFIANATAGSGNISMYTGSGGFNARTLFGQINLVARGASSSFINQTTADSGQDLTICVKGVYDSLGISTGETQGNKLILCSESVAGDSIYLTTSGGTYLSSKGQINIQSSDTGIGINIGTTVEVPVTIGTSNSTTTIKGNLDVQGTTTTYDSTIVQIKDNFIQVNNQPSGVSTLDGGLAIKRYQPAGNGLCSNLAGEIVKDIGEFVGNVTSVTSGSSSAVSVSIGSTDFNTSADAYAGYWLKVTYSDGTAPSNNYCWVRRVKSSSSSASAATFIVYNTLDQTTTLGSPIPDEGMDLPGDANLVNFPTFPATLTFSIYPCHWILSMWDESNKEYALVCTQSLGEYTNVVEPHHYINLHVNNIKANVLTVNSINNLTADVQFTTQLPPNTDPVILNPATSIPTPLQLGYPYPTYGVFIILVRPKNIANTSTSPYAIFVIGRRNSASACGQVARLISVKGINGEMLDMDWPGGSYPRLFYRPAPGTGTVDYTLKFIAV